MTKEMAGEFIALVGAAILAGIGGAMAWFRSQRKEIEADMDDLRCEMRSQVDEHHTNDRDIAVLQTEIRNNIDRLEEINGATQETNRKLDKLANTLTTVLLAVNRK